MGKFDVPEPSLVPEEPQACGVCGYCGEDISPGEQVYIGDEGQIHAECMGNFIADRLSERLVAEALGYELKTVGGETTCLIRPFLR